MNSHHHTTVGLGVSLNPLGVLRHFCRPPISIHTLITQIELALLAPPASQYLPTFGALLILPKPRCFMAVRAYFFLVFDCRALFTANVQALIANPASDLGLPVVWQIIDHWVHSVSVALVFIKFVIRAGFSMLVAVVLGEEVWLWQFVWPGTQGYLTLPGSFMAVWAHSVSKHCFCTVVAFAEFALQTMPTKVLILEAFGTFVHLSSPKALMTIWAFDW